MAVMCSLAWAAVATPLDASVIRPGGPDGPIAGINANTLRRAGTITLSTDVTHEAGNATSYSVLVSGDFTDPGGQTGVPIEPGQTISGGMAAQADTDQLSGLYTGTMTLLNDNDATDPDDEVNLTLAIYDPSQITSDAAIPVDPFDDPQIFIFNSAAGPHEGALRASVKLTGTAVTGGVVVTGMDAGTLVDPGDTLPGRVETAGLLSGAYDGSFTVNLQMRTADDRAINFAPSLDPITWDIAFTLEDTPADEVTLNAGQTFRNGKLAVNSDVTAAAVIAGQTSTDQTVTLELTENPEGDGTPTASILGQAVDLTFEQPGDRYALQITYDPTDLPLGTDERDLRVLFYDPGPQRWTDAIDANSDGGGGAQFFEGSFTAFQDVVGGALPLSAHGVDAELHRVWAVLDHASIFGAGTAIQMNVPGDFDLDGDVDAFDLGIWQTGFGITSGAAVTDGDADGDGDVDAFDLGLWQTNFGAGTAATASSVDSSTVPIPASLTFVLIAAGGGIARRRIG